MANAFVFETSDAKFDEEVVKAPTPVVVDFWAPWCGPCRQIAPILDELATTYGGKVKVAKVNVDVNKKIATNFGIQGIPTLIAFRGGEVVGRMVGFNGRAALQTFFAQAAG